ncbi:MAG: hypothetical protein RSB16_06335 [Raoultibacter sp.]
MLKNTGYTPVTIANTFMEFVAQAPCDKRITVVQLTKAIAIDRKTFYRYFDSVDDLVQWIFRDFLRDLLSGEEFARYRLHKPDSTLEDKYPDWPICVKVEAGDDFYSQELFYKAIGRHFESHRAYYSKIFASYSYFNLIDYMVRLFLPALREDAITMLDGREMPEPVLNFLAEYHVMGIFGRVSYHFTKTGRFILQEELDPFFCYAHIMLKKTIDSLYVQQDAKWYQDILRKNSSREVYRGNLNSMLENEQGLSEGDK